MSVLKLGRKPAIHTVRTLRSAIVMAGALDPLGPPPAASNDYTIAVKVPWPMFLNDKLGDCVAADSAHTLMLRTANASSIVIPTDDDVTRLYEAVGGYVPDDLSTDQGCNETSMCEYLEHTGFLGHKADTIGSVDPANLDHIKWAIQLFGSCRIGLNLPQSAMDQFNNGEPWSVSGDDTIIGGHDVPLVKYALDRIYCVTWGYLQPMTPEFLVKYNEESHVELFSDWVRSQGTAPSGFDLADLEEKLKALN